MSDAEKSTSNEEYLTIAEYATARGISTAAVYKRLEKGLKPWVVVKNGKKLLLSRVLYEEQRKGVINHSTTKSRKVVNDNLETLSTFTTLESTELIAELREQITFLRAEIASQRDTIKEKDRQIDNYGKQMLELIQQSNQLAAKNAELVDQAHRLNAADKPHMIAAQGEPITDQSAEAAPEPPAAPPAAEPGEVQQQAEAVPQAESAGEDKPRRGFWARLFGLD